MRRVKHNQYALFLMLTAVLCVFLTACGKSDTSLPEKDGTAASAAYAVILKSKSAPFTEELRSGIELEAKRQGKTVEFFYAADASDVQGQIEMMQNCAEQGYKAIGVEPIAADADLTQGISAAGKKGIHVVLFGDAVDLASQEALNGVFAAVTVDTKRLGVLGANYIVSQLVRGGDVAIFSETAVDSPQKQGAESVFHAASEIHLSDTTLWNNESTSLQKRAAQLLEMHPNLKAIYCCTDAAALEGCQAAKMLNRAGDILIVGTGGTDAARKSIKNGGLNASVAIDYTEIGAVAFQKMTEAALNNADAEFASAPEVVFIDPYIIEQ